MNGKRIKVWDLPTRLFHWLLALLVSLAVLTGKTGGGAIEWHARIGLAILGLLAFRLAWGILGPTHVRFASFFPTPRALRAYLGGSWRGLGHNPLGALSVFGLLALLALQVGTGLFANDDIAFRGPLFDTVSKESSDRLTGIHQLTVNILLGLIGLHLAAIAFYTLFKKHDLVRPMLHGWKELGEGEESPATKGGSAVALIFSLAFAVFVVYAGTGAWARQVEAPPAAAAAAPW